MKKLAEGEHLGEIKGVPDKIKRVFVTAHEITPEWHVKMQAAFQRSTDNAVSKTINFPQSATREDIARAYMLAYEEGLKGITIYRDKSRDTQVLTTGKKPEKAVVETGPVKLTPRKRPTETKGSVARVARAAGRSILRWPTTSRASSRFFPLSASPAAAPWPSSRPSAAITLALRSGVDVRPS